jgi:hypothetical protein
MLQRHKPKADILKNMTRGVFKETECDEVVVEMKPNTDSRSIKQNKLYWKWLKVFEETGNTKDAMHNYLREMYLGCEFEKVRGHTIKIIPSTTKLGVKEFSEYLLKIDILAQEMGLILPRPEDLYYDSIGRKSGEQENG